MRTGESAPRDRTYGVLEEIAARVRERREADSGILPPLLLLGVMERVGSNWMMDTLRPVTEQHNEPFRQQLCPGHPLSALTRGVVGLEDAGSRLGAYGRHWLVTFAVGKYAHVRQVIKETNLFFALPTLLSLFPDAPVVLLTRSPLGVASSFARSGLYRRWDYAERYQQMVCLTDGTEYGVWAAVVPDDDPPELVALARLQVLNTLLLARGLCDRGEAEGLVVIRYETAVLYPDAVRASLARVVPRAPGFGSPPGEVTPAAEETYATTNHKTQLNAWLDRPAAETIRAASLRALAAGRRAVPALAWELARDWADGDHLYSLISGSRSAPRPLVRRVSRGGDQVCPVRWIQSRSNDDLLWRNLLVGNGEFAAFLNELAAVGLANCLDGGYLLACEMPHERGGRLHYDLREGRWIVSPGFDSHPAYWVTWIGAAAFAARHGARLPTRAEMIAETSRNGFTVTNCSYQSGDTIPVTEFGRQPGEVHHLVGNLQVWCADGPPLQLPGPAMRWLHGVAWNTPGTLEEIGRQRARHLSGASRGVGIRLVRDAVRRPAASVAQISDALRCWTGLLADRGQPLHILDEALADTLTGLSQPDSGLRTHIRTRSGESSHG
jgi:hypothetical protein